MKTPIYLDHAAATPLAPEVLEAMLPYLKTEYYNPSAQYLAARSVKKDLDTARARIAHWLGARPSEIIFTAGGTEANNLTIHGIMRRYPQANAIVSTIEHEAILRPVELYSHKLAPVLEDGRLDISRLEKLIDDQTVLVSIMYVNNEIGTIEPLKHIAEILVKVRAERRKAGNTLPLFFHTDACQAGSYLDLHVARLGVDLMTINASKLYGPKQTGALYVASSIELSPLVLGGGQERKLRSGTENVAGIIGFAKALDMAQEMRHQEAMRARQLQSTFLNTLSNTLSNLQINGSLKHRIPSNIHVTFPGHDNERLMMALDEHGIIAASGSACSASNDEPSHVLKAIGLSDELARSSLRFTLGRSTTDADIVKVVTTIQKLVA